MTAPVSRRSSAIRLGGKRRRGSTTTRNQAVGDEHSTVPPCILYRRPDIAQRRRGDLGGMEPMKAAPVAQQEPVRRAQLRGWRGRRRSRASRSP